MPITLEQRKERKNHLGSSDIPAIRRHLATQDGADPSRPDRDPCRIPGSGKLPGYERSGMGSAEGVSPEPTPGP